MIAVTAARHALPPAGQATRMPVSTTTLPPGAAFAAGGDAAGVTVAPLGWVAVGCVVCSLGRAGASTGWGSAALVPCGCSPTVAPAPCCWPEVPVPAPPGDDAVV